MRIVVTGVHGVVGRGLALRLLSLGHDVTGVGRRRPESWPGAVGFVASDRFGATVLAGADAVVHCDGDHALLETVTGTTPVGRIVVASSILDAAPPPFEGLHVRSGIVLGRMADPSTLSLFAGPVAVDAGGSGDRPIQVIHPHDLQRVLVRAVLDGESRGTVDVAAGGETSVRAIAAALGRPALRVPSILRAVVPAGPLARELAHLDPSRLRDEWGIVPVYDARRCVEDFALAARGRIAIGSAVQDIPWRLPRVLDIPAIDAPTPDGIEPVAAGPDTESGEFDTPIDPRFPAFIATNLSEALPGPFSPSSASVTVLGTRAAGLVISERLRPGGAVQREMSVRTTGVFGHRLYAGITTGHFMAHTVPFIDPAIVLSGFFGHTEEGLELFGEQLPPVAPRGIARQLRGGLTFVNCLIGLSAGSGHDTRDFTCDVEAFELAAAAPADLDDRRLRELILLGRDHVVHGWVLASASILLCAGYGVVLRLLCGRDVLPAAGSDLVSAQALSAVHRLVSAARRDPVAARLLSAPEIEAAALAAEAPDFFADLTRELALIGHRGPSEVEMRSATYADDPDLLLRMVTKALTAAPRALPAPPEVPLRAKPVAAAAAVQIREREVRRDRMVRAIWVLRRLLREYGRRLAAAGEIGDADDVFYLLVDELDAPPADIAGVVVRRRAEQLALRELHPPEAFNGRWEPTTAPTEGLSGGETLWGIGVSGGRARGPARVVRAETIDDLQPGEVLVAKVTDVGYTPAFAYAAAVVTELGGPTSHAAIVAREFGVPCVVNARGAASRLTTGTLVEVDGATGEVTVLGS
jgi:phosphohistidine swiveling domain-containing protein/nucleoside-diphosphate-sugar epimerase